MEFKGTKGEWKKDIGVDEDANGFYQNIVYTDLSISPAFAFGFTIEEAEANAQLIADAGTTANKCGKLPSELLAERDELLEALKLLTNNPSNKDMLIAEKLMNKTLSK